SFFVIYFFPSFSFHVNTSFLVFPFFLVLNNFKDITFVKIMSYFIYFSIFNSSYLFTFCVVVFIKGVVVIVIFFICLNTGRFLFISFISSHIISLYSFSVFSPKFSFIKSLSYTIFAHSIVSVLSFSL